MSIEEYKADLVAVFEGEPWYGKSVMAILSQLNGSDLHKNLPNGNNVAQIIEHMITWRTWGINMFAGNYDYWIKVNSNDDWQREEAFSEKDLEDLLDRLKASQERIIELISGKQDAWLNEKIPERKFTFAEALNGIKQHDIYHLGQIALLTK